jgi:hypothetical protein
LFVAAKVIFPAGTVATSVPTAYSWNITFTLAAADGVAADGGRTAGLRRAGDRQ